MLNYTYFSKTINKISAYVQHELVKPGFLIRMILVNNKVLFNSDMLITQCIFLEKFKIQYLMMARNGDEIYSRN